MQNLAAFPFLDITESVSDLASNLYRFDVFDAAQQNVNKNFEKRKFDVFHYATAFVNNVEMFSDDRDLVKIKQLHEKMLAKTQK